MTIEVRQMLIRSAVASRAASETRAELPAAALERLRAEVLAECKAWLEERLQQARER